MNSSELAGDSTQAKEEGCKWKYADPLYVYTCLARRASTYALGTRRQMLKPRFQVLARHAAGLRARGLTTISTSRPLRKVVTTLFLGGTSAAVAAYFLLPDISRGAPTCDNVPLSPSHFTPAKLTSSTIASSGTKILTVAIPPELLPKGSDFFAPIWSVFIKDDDIQVERPYTPLDGVDEDGNMRFWIKRYQHGEVSRWLYSKQVGDTIEIRGPLRTWSWKDDAWDEIILVRNIKFYKIQLSNDFCVQDIWRYWDYSILPAAAYRIL